MTVLYTPTYSHNQVMALDPYTRSESPKRRRADRPTSPKHIKFTDQEKPTKRSSSKDVDRPLPSRRSVGQAMHRLHDPVGRRKLLKQVRQNIDPKMQHVFRMFNTVGAPRSVLAVGQHFIKLFLRFVPGLAAAFTFNWGLDLSELVAMISEVRALAYVQHIPKAYRAVREHHTSRHAPDKKALAHYLGWVQRAIEVSMLSTTLAGSALSRGVFGSRGPQRAKSLKRYYGKFLTARLVIDLARAGKEAAKDKAEEQSILASQKELNTEGFQRLEDIAKRRKQRRKTVIADTIYIPYALTSAMASTPFSPTFASACAIVSQAMKTSRYWDKTKA